jgi:HSP90 family molecular chaperone
MGRGDATIQIRPTNNATYVPRTWKLVFDAEAVLARLVEDVYESPNIFIRELIQNAADASRCQMYLDLQAQVLSTPDSPTRVDESIRERYAIRVALEERSIVNELSGQVEKRQAVIVEDSGIGMDQ